MILETFKNKANSMNDTGMHDCDLTENLQHKINCKLKKISLLILNGNTITNILTEMQAIQ